jgi:hypothetical protein
MSFHDQTQPMRKFLIFVQRDHWLNQEHHESIVEGRTKEAEACFLRYATNRLKGDQLARNLGYTDFSQPPAVPLLVLPVLDTSHASHASCTR